MSPCARLALIRETERRVGQSERQCGPSGEGACASRSCIDNAGEERPRPRGACTRKRDIRPRGRGHRRAPGVLGGSRAFRCTLARCASELRRSRPPPLARHRALRFASARPREHSARCAGLPIEATSRFASSRTRAHRPRTRAGIADSCVCRCSRRAQHSAALARRTRSRLHSIDASAHKVR